MKTAPKSNAVVRLDPQVHREAKILAARQGLTLTSLITEALAAELRRRQAKELRRMAKADSTLSAAMASQIPMQTR